MPRRKLLLSFLILTGLAGLLYVLVSLFLISPRRLIFGVDKRTGEVRFARQGIVFLPPHRFYRLSFESREGWAQRDGIAWIRSREGVPFQIFYRLRFGVRSDRLPDAGRLVKQGWSAWIRARVSEAVGAVAKDFPVEELTSPGPDFGRKRDLLRTAVIRHLARSGLEVSAFQIQKLEVDRDALREFKRAELRRRARGPVGRVALFEIDGADWQLVSELIVDGRLPNIKALVEGGVEADVQTIQPMLPPVLSTTVATGASPDRHGIIDFFEPGTRQPVSSIIRRVPALWDIADAFERSAEVVSWWTDWPPLENRAAVFDPPMTLLQTAVYPPSLEPAVRASIVPAETIQFSQISRFVNITKAEFDEAIRRGDEGDPVVLLRETLAKVWSDHRAAIAIYHARKPMLLMMNYEGTDEVGHLFGPFHPPYREGVDTTLYRKYWPTVASYYSDIDRMLGEWMRVIANEAPDTTVILFSTHGLEWGRDRPKTLPGGGSGIFSHRAPGLLIGWGNHIRPSRTRETISVYDIAPTVLALLGLPPATEMPGEFASWMFDGIEPIGSVRIGTYADLVTARTYGSGISIDPASYRTYLEKSGHVVDPDRGQMPVLARDPAQQLSREEWGAYAWFNNLGVRLRQQGKLDEAEQALGRAIELNPDRPIPYLNLSLLMFDRQRYTQSEELFQQAIEKGLPEPERYYVDFAALYRSRNLSTRAIDVLAHGRELFPDSYPILTALGSAMMAAERYTEGLPLLENALALQPTSSEVLNNLGLYYFKKNDYGRALDYWNRSLSVDSRQPQIRKAVASVQSRM